MHCYAKNSNITKEMVKCMESSIKHISSDNRIAENLFTRKLYSTDRFHAKCINCESNINSNFAAKSGVLYCCSACTLTLGLISFFKKLKQFN